MLDLSPQMTTALLLSTGLLLAFLLVLVFSRARIFTQYLEHMTGIELKPSDVARVFRSHGKAGVREMFLELIIREDLRDGPAITPDTPPDRKLLVPEKRK
ncbi:MAG: hypothetical protein V1750_10465 [Acidobacteriota bacterium]